MIQANTDQVLVTQLFNTQPDAVLWLRPVFPGDAREGPVVDFEFQYCNQKAAQMLGVAPEAVLGARLLHTPLLDPQSRERIFQHCLQVWHNGESVEFNYHNARLDRYYNVQRSLVAGGVLSITRDRTDEVHAELQRKEQDQYFRQILDSAADGILVLESIRDTRGTIVDFRVTHCNRKCYEIGRFPPDTVGRRLLEALPHLLGSDQLRWHKEVAETGKSLRFETSFRDEAGHEYGWFIVSLSRLRDGVISTFVDVTQRRHNERRIEEQKVLLANIFASALSGMFAAKAVRDEEGRILDFIIQKINPAFTQLVGQTESEVIGKPLTKVFPSADKNGLFELKIAVMESGLPIRKEIHYDGDGLDAWFDLSLCRLEGDSLLVTFSDVTEAREAELQVAETMEKLDTVINTVQAGFFLAKPIYDEEGTLMDFRFTMVNQALAEFVGEPADTLIGEPGSRWFASYTENGLLDRYRRTYETGVGEQFDFHYVSGRQDVWVNILTRRIGDELLGSFTDFTQVKRLQLLLEQKVLELRRSNSSLEEFAYAASHDLQEPLRKIHFFSDRLRAALKPGPEHNAHFERMESATRRMRQLIEDLLTYSRVSSKSAEPAPVPLDDVLQQVLQDIEANILETGALIHIGPLPTISGDERQLRQLFQNLLSNALKYRKPDTTPEIRICCRQCVESDRSQFGLLPHPPGNAWLIEVSDNGIGFEQQHADKIFQVFQRLHGRNDYEGSGVGLAIVRKVVLHHKGQIFAEGEPGKGATFRIMLPGVVERVAAPPNNVFVHP